MRLIDADALLAKIMMEAPDFMDGGSSITKAFIMAMIKTRSVTPTIDAIPVVRCNECKYYEGVHNVQGHAPCSKWDIGGVIWNDYCSRFEPSDEAIEDAFGEDG